MALQVWLPLNGNLQNQGVSGATFISVGTWSYGVGKVTSKCMTSPNPTSSSATSYIYTTSTFKYTKNFSVSVWVKLPSANSSYASYIATEGRADGTNYGWGISGNATSLTVQFGNGSNSKSSLTANTWHLVTFTVDNSNKCSFYLDGVLNGSFTPSTLPTYAEDNGIGIGLFKYSSGNIYQWNGSINDFRLYNHCLSIKEVKNLAKGLMLHYTLSRNGTNLLRNTSTEKSWTYSGTSYSDSNYSQETITPASDSYYTMSFDAKSNRNSTSNFITYLYNNNSGRQCDSVKGYIDGQLVYTGSASDGGCVMPTYTYYRHYVIVRHFNTNATALAKQNVFRISNSGSTALTMYIKNAKIEVGDKSTPWIPNMTDIMSKNFPINSVSPSGYVNQMTTYTWGPSTGQWNYTTLTPNGGGNYQPRIHRVRFKVTVLAGSFSSVTILFYNLSTSTGNTRVDAPIVNGYVDTFITPTTAVPNLLIYAGVAGATANNQIRIENLLVYDQFNVSDNSGYGNNGSAINITDVYPDTPRYLTSYPFNGSNNYIYLPKNSARPTDKITISLWCYKLGTSNCAPISCTEGSGWNICSDNGYLMANMWTSGKGSYVIASTDKTWSELINEWHYIAVTYDGSSVKIYLDGVLKQSVSTSGTIVYLNNYTFVGAEAGGNTSTPSGNYFDGYISDVRIYATALSADDILELYKVSATIDKNKNMHCYELVES